jgi:gliding motility-associated lipoprotein GldH
VGSGLGDVITFQVPILHRKILNQKGKYTVTIAQDMRLESLANIVSAGLRVEQQEEIY